MDWAKVKLLITDFDGVWTDDAVYVDQTGVESVRCLRADGFGITRLQAAGVPVIVLSAEANPVVAARCKKLGVSCFQGLDDKLATLRRLCDTDGKLLAPLSEIAYMGNDVNDIECLKAVGFPVIVKNAEDAVFNAMDAQPDRNVIPTGRAYVTRRAGGYGAVREVCDLILEERNG